MASFTLPLRTSTSVFARISPTPTQLNGRTIVYGRPYWSRAACAKYSTASFWKPYDERGGGTSRSWPSNDGQQSVDSNTIEELRYVTFCNRASSKARIAASHEAAVM